MRASKGERVSRPHYFFFKQPQMNRILHLDFETYSSVDLKTAGRVRYTESPDFEPLLLAWCLDGQNINLIDFISGDSYPPELLEALSDSTVKIAAHNASFERAVLFMEGFRDILLSRFDCSMVRAAYAGYPSSLEDLSEALRLPQDKAKMAEGKALIRYFCMPCKPTKANGRRTRNLPEHDPQKWEAFKEYCRQDVRAEMEVSRLLSVYQLPQFERDNYILDQRINDKGVKIDLDLARHAAEMTEKHEAEAFERMRELTGIDNPNSGAQLKMWLEPRTLMDVNSLTKETIPQIIETSDDPTVREVLELKLTIGKTSLKKYPAMLEVTAEDGRAHGLFQFYGAGRTGRWAGRLIQSQNLPRNYFPGSDLDLARELVKAGDYEGLRMIFGDVPNVLSELIRTAFVPEDGHLFVVADYSAIEARVIAWLASENWRLKVFATHGKIYEASASKMFHVPIEQIGKGSELRQRGKVAELALGYQGGVGALKTMGAEKMGLSENEMEVIVSRWREANPAIVKLWKVVESAAIEAVEIPGRVVTLPDFRGLTFQVKHKALSILLPSGRELFYQSPRISSNAYGRKAIEFMGVEQQTRQWGYVDTYGGKLVENIVQAISRDLLAYSMQGVVRATRTIPVMHVHDEVVLEVPKERAAEMLETVSRVMGEEVPWAKGLPLRADGYVTEYYKKD